MATFMVEDGISTESCRAWTALRTRVSMSAIGSVIVTVVSPACYQLDLVTPGISPASASLRKSIRHNPNFRRKARGRPHSWQRLCCCTRNFGGRFDFSISAFLANAPIS